MKTMITNTQMHPFSQIALETGLGFACPDYHREWNLDVDSKPGFEPSRVIINYLQQLYIASSGSFHSRLKRGKKVKVGTGTR